MNGDALRRYMLEALHWNSAKGAVTLSLGAMGETTAPAIAAAPPVVAFFVACEGTGIPPLWMQKKLAAHAAKEYPHPLIVFSDGKRLAWHFAGCTVETPLPLPSPDDSPFLGTLRIPLDHTITPLAILERIEGAFVESQEKPDMQASHPLIEAGEQFLRAIEIAIEQTSTLITDAMLGKGPLGRNDALELLQHLAQLREKALVVTGEARDLLQRYPQLPTPSALHSIVAKAKAAPHKKKYVAGPTTPQAAFRCPILQALIERGGSGSASDILDRVFELMKHRLTKADIELIVSNEPKWRNTARWERKKMIEEGLLRNDSPTGIWEITESGRRYYHTHCKGTP
ncbi:MAG: winged helix-turn-helix domain-containing protein [Chlorobi bacterium]|jgi:hypothetical protein|nr:winged helix-turn-helix domain-containing protein [Chlorobiota bacterium]